MLRHTMEWDGMCFTILHNGMDTKWSGHYVDQRAHIVEATQMRRRNLPETHDLRR